MLAARQCRQILRRHFGVAVVVIKKDIMQICYIDESGDTGAFTLDNVNSQPVFLLTGLLMPQDRLSNVTRSVIALKQRHFPNMKPEGNHWHDWLRVEVKGAELRRFIREGGKRKRRLALWFMSQALSILEQNDCRIISRIYVKSVGEEFDGTSVYASAIQRIVAAFENYVGERSEKGIAILDSRNKNKNAPLAHSLFTWNFSAHGHEYNHLAELPLFGHSENHAMIQLADWISSAFLFPMATLTYCLKHESECLHIDKAYAPIRKMFGQRLKALQYRYELPDGTKRGGIHIQGKSIKLNSLLLFGDPPNEQK